MRRYLLCCGLVLLAGLAGAEPAAPGQDATSEQAAAMDRAVTAFVAALQARDMDAVARLTAMPDGATLRDWPSLVPAADLRTFRGAEQTAALLGRGVLRVVEVKTWGERGVARLEATIRATFRLPLAQRDGQWLVDFAAVEQTLAERKLGSHVAALNGADILRAIVSVMPATSETLPDELLPLFVLAPERARVETREHRVALPRGVVELAGEVAVQFAAPLERDRSGWNIASRPTFVLMRADEPLTPALAQDRSGRVTQSCIANLKCLSLALLEYARQHGAFPAADGWSSALLAAGHPNENVFTCPAVSVTGGKWGYAMNVRLSRLAPRRVTQPESTVLLFESGLLQPNAYDKDRPAGACTVTPPRHDDVISYVFADGHAASFRQPLGPDFFRPVRTQQQLLKLPPAITPGGG